MKRINLLLSGSILVTTLCAVAPIAAQTPSGSRAPERQSLQWLNPKPGADIAVIAKRLTARGVTVIELAPEGRLLVAMAQEQAADLDHGNDIESFEVLINAVQTVDADAVDPKERGLGARPPTPEEEVETSHLFQEVSEIEVAPLALARATIAGSIGLPSSADNSLSNYFPPIRSQGSQGSCTAWAAGYYYSTYTQARDENLVVSNGNNAHIHSPAFLYPLVNWGNDGGAYTAQVVARLTQVGCSSWASKPYDQTDHTSWPSEAAWIEALNNRGMTPHQIDARQPGGIDAIKQHLANGNIAVTQFPVYSTWYQGYPNNLTGIDNGVYYAHDGPYVGGHAVTIVGYDDNRSYLDHRDGATKTGAFLIANSWGSYWGLPNSSGAGTKGFMWVAYTMFTTGSFGPYAYYNTDRENYRPSLYASIGIDHPQRAMISLRGGVGPAASPLWISHMPINSAGGNNLGLSASNRIAVDLSDGVAHLGSNPLAATFNVAASLSSSASTNGTLASASFYHDFDGDGNYLSLHSSATPLAIQPGRTVFAESSSAGMPVIVIDTAPIMMDLVQGETATGSRPVANHGTGPLNVSILGDNSDDWLELTAPPAGVEPETSAPLAYHIDSAGLAPGIHQRTIEIASNDPSMPLLGIPLTLTVTVPGMIVFETPVAGPLAIPGGSATSGPADPFPSTLSVANVPGSIVGVKVKLAGFSHTYPSDLDILLTSPGGESVMLMGSAGGSQAVAGADLVFFQDIQAPTVPTPIISGTYRPTINYSRGDIPGGPAGPYLNTLDPLLGTSPNGTWQLHIYDRYNSDVGSLDGWRIEFITVPSTDTFLGWSLAHFGSGSPDGAADADPDGDGLVNLMEYALGLDPRQPSHGAQPQLEMAMIEGNAALGTADQVFLGLRVGRTTRRNDINYVVEVSDGLATWSRGPGHTVTVVDNQIELYVRDAHPISAAPRRFMRLCVEQQ